jgi:hypothetical protein
MFMALNSLEDFSKSRDGGRIYKYFKSLVDLAANLNIGRNTQSYENFLSMYPFEAVF